MKASAILGLNARTQVFSYPHNKSVGKTIANSKLKTHRVLQKMGIPNPKVYKIFKKPEDIFDFDWNTLPDSFALKPSKGLGGNGIIVVKKRSKDGEGWITTQRNKVTPDDLKLHILDILEGAYSKRNTPEWAFIQEYVGRHKAFRKYSFRGTPDIRVIVFNYVPVMAMLRLPTKDSGGRANLHQGAIGVGVDIATGITTRAIWNDEPVKIKPGTKRKLHGIKIPHWNQILEIASRCDDIPGLQYFGADIVLHPERGPMVLELNDQPGLSIQLANMQGLRKRLERVEDLEVRGPEHGVRIAKALFAARFADRVLADEGIKTISAVQEITIKGAKRKMRKKVLAKVDTGAWRTSISEHLAEELGLLSPNNILWTRRVRSSLGLQERPVISLTFWMAGRKITTPASVAKRMALRYPIIIGRKNLKGFLIKPQISVEKHSKAKKKKTTIKEK